MIDGKEKETVAWFSAGCTSAVARMEGESVSIGGYYLFITPERWEAYKEQV